MFHSHLIYSCQIWSQNNTILRKLEPLQNKAMRIINFKNNEYNVNEFYETNKILKIADYCKLLLSLQRSAPSQFAFSWGMFNE